MSTGADGAGSAPSQRRKLPQCNLCHTGRGVLATNGTTPAFPHTLPLPLGWSLVTTTAQMERSSRLRALLHSPSFLAVCTVVMNVATYGFQMVGARILGPEQYGGVASMMNLLLVVGVFQLGLQATAARRVAAAPTDIHRIEQVIKSVTYRTALAVSLAMLVLSPVVWKVLKLDSIIPALLVAVCAAPMTVMGGQAGILQGERRWRDLSVLYLALGLPRLVVGTAAILLRPSEGAAMAGVAAAQFAPMVVGWWLLRHRRVRTSPTALRATVTEMLHGSFALLGFFTLSNVDILIARNILNHREAGLYASGLILTKAVLFLPQFVVVVAFPAMSTAGARLRTLVSSLGAVVGLGIVSTLGAWLLSGIALIFVGGSKYSDIEGRLWIFAILGTLLSLLQLLVYSVLARQHRSSAYVIWIAVAALIGFGSQAGSLNGLVRTVTIVDAILMSTLLAISLWHLREELPEKAALKDAA